MASLAFTKRTLLHPSLRHAGLKATTTKTVAATFSSMADKLVVDKTNYVQTRTPSEFKLGKHRSNALELLQQQPIIEVDGDMAVCDGGGGALGHPLEYIKLGNRADYDSPEDEAKGVACIYCGLRYRKKVGSGH